MRLTTSRPWSVLSYEAIKSETTLPRLEIFAAPPKNRDPDSTVPSRAAALQQPKSEGARLGFSSGGRSSGVLRAGPAAPCRADSSNKQCARFWHILTKSSRANGGGFSLDTLRRRLRHRPTTSGPQLVDPSARERGQGGEGKGPNIAHCSEVWEAGPTLFRRPRL